MAVTPRWLIDCRHLSQRTGVLTWLTIRFSQSAPVLTASPSAFERSTTAGSAAGSPSAALRSASTASVMCLVWKAPATCSGRSRALAGGFAAKAASWSMVPAATIWPAPFTLAGVSPYWSMAASTSASSPPSTAVMPVGEMAAAAAIALPLTWTSRMMSAAGRTSASTPAVNSPMLCPAVRSA